MAGAESVDFELPSWVVVDATGNVVEYRAAPPHLFTRKLARRLSEGLERVC